MASNIPFWSRKPTETFSEAEVFDDLLPGGGDLGLNWDVVQINETNLPGPCVVRIDRTAEVVQHITYAQHTSIEGSGKDAKRKLSAAGIAPDVEGSVTQATLNRLNHDDDAKARADVLSGTRAGTIDDVTKVNPARVSVTLRMHDPGQWEDWQLLGDVMFYGFKQHKTAPYRIDHPMCASKGITHVLLTSVSEDQPTPENNNIYTVAFTFTEAASLRVIAQNKVYGQSQNAQSAKGGALKPGGPVTAGAAADDGPPEPDL